MKMTTKRCEEIFTLFFSFIRKIYFKNHTLKSYLFIQFDKSHFENNCTNKV